MHLIRSGILGVCLLLTAPLSAAAAALYLDPASTTLNVGDAATIAIRLDVDQALDECVNAVDATISYAGDLSVIDVSTGRSIFSMWVEQPVIDPVARTVTFAGGVPNGYCGRIEGDPELTNVIAELIVRAPGVEGEAEAARIGFSDDTLVYLNDGYGTALEPTTYGTVVAFSGEIGETIVDPWSEAVAEDTTPPAPFPILFDINPSGKYYISFNTVDKQTGIDQYQVMEEPLEQFGSFTWGRANAPWVQTRSPYVLKDQSLNSVIYVKALDKAGNEYIATYVPEESLRTLSSSQVIGYGLIALSVFVLLVVGFVGFIIWRKRRARKLAAEITSHYESE